MSGFIAKYVGKKILGESISNKFGTEDPYFESVPATRLDGRPGKPTKRKKATPPGISDHDAKVLTKVKRRAYRLDMCLFNCCGIRFGWSSVIGIVPAIGDVIDALFALMVLRTCGQIEGGLPAQLRARMMLNIVVDFAIGLVPFLGDIVDALFRANTRNAALLEAHLREVGKKNLRKSGLPIPDVDPSDPSVYDRQESPAYSPERRQPAPAEEMHSGRGWTGRSREADVEEGRGPIRDNRGGGNREEHNYQKREDRESRRKERRNYQPDERDNGRSRSNRRR